MRIGFIGLGNVGGKLAGSLARNGYDLVVRDLDRDAARPFLDGGAGWADSPKEMAEQCEVVITCLPSPAACSAVMEAGDGVIAGLSESLHQLSSLILALGYMGAISLLVHSGALRWLVRGLSAVGRTRAILCTEG